MLLNRLEKLDTLSVGVVWCGRGYTAVNEGRRRY
jgi:hypothetical protein